MRFLLPCWIFLLVMWPHPVFYFNARHLSPSRSQFMQYPAPNSIPQESNAQQVSICDPIDISPSPGSPGPKGPVEFPGAALWPPALLQMQTKARYSRHRQCSWHSYFPSPAGQTYFWLVALDQLAKYFCKLLTFLIQLHRLISTGVLNTRNFNVALLSEVYAVWVIEGSYCTHGNQVCCLRDML